MGKVIETKLGSLSSTDKKDWISVYDIYLEEGSLLGTSKILGIGDTTLARYFKKFRFHLLTRKEINKRKYERAKRTNMEKYGVENPFQSEEIKDKIKKTNMEKYGVEYASQSEEIKEKVKSTSVNNHGVFHTKSKKIKDKIKKTNMEKYGLPSLLKDDKFRQKNIMEKYGVENPFQSEEIKDKIKKTNMEKYGVEYASQSEEIKEKVKSTQRHRMLDKWEKYFYNNSEYLMLDKYISMHENGKSSWRRYTFKHISCGLEFKRTLRSGRDIKCPKCYFCQSREELSIREYLTEMGFNYETNVRNVIKNPKTNKYLELDIYIPDLNVAIEYNGYPFHLEVSQANPKELEIYSKFIKEDGYHEHKNKLCEASGIRLINIWYYEDILSRLEEINNEFGKLPRRKD